MSWISAVSHTAIPPSISLAWLRTTVCFWTRLDFYTVVSWRAGAKLKSLYFAFLELLIGEFIFAFPCVGYLGCTVLNNYQMLIIISQKVCASSCWKHFIFVGNPQRSTTFISPPYTEDDFTCSFHCTICSILGGTTGR
jgi:hypothetical protein